jgi:hypothetical protein
LKDVAVDAALSTATAGVGQGRRQGLPAISKSVAPEVARGAEHVAPSAAKGTLTAAERAENQAIADRFKTRIDVVGSRAAGRRRDVESAFPVGKGPGTRSDIDFIIDGQVDIDTRGALTDALRQVGNGAGSVISPRGFSSAPNIVFTPGGE